MTAHAHRLEIKLPCGGQVDARQFDLSTQTMCCSCGDVHAVVTSAETLDRFVPEAVVDALRATVEPADTAEPFGVTHVLAKLHEEHPDRISSADLSEIGEVGYARLWVTRFDGRRLHEHVVEALIELMSHAMGQADNETAAAFDQQLAAFDAAAFVDTYRD